MIATKENVAVETIINKFQILHHKMGEQSYKTLEE